MKRLIVLGILFLVAAQLFSQVTSLKDQLAFSERFRKNKLQKANFLFWRTAITRLSATHSEEANFRDLPYAAQQRVPTAPVRVPLSILFATNTHKAICLSVKKKKPLSLAKEVLIRNLSLPLVSSFQ